MTGEPEESGPRCSIARTLEVVGERWSFLVVRDAFRGRTRFAEFRESLGIASDVLTARLRTLVDAGILERRPYRDAGARERFSYHLTPAGLDLRLVLGALQQWGDEHRPSGYGPAALLRSTRDGGRARVAFVDDDDHVLSMTDVVNVAGPGALDPAGFAGASAGPVSSAGSPG